MILIMHFVVLQVQIRFLILNFPISFEILIRIELRITTFVLSLLKFTIRMDRTNIMLFSDVASHYDFIVEISYCALV